MIVTHKTQDDFDWMSVIGCPPTCDNYYKNSVWAYDPKRDEIDMIFAEDLKKFRGKYSLWRPCIIVKPPKPIKHVNIIKHKDGEES